MNDDVVAPKMAWCPDLRPRADVDVEAPKCPSHAVRDHGTIAGPQDRRKESLVQRRDCVYSTMHARQYGNPLTGRQPA